MNEQQTVVVTQASGTNQPATKDGAIMMACAGSDLISNALRQSRILFAGLSTHDSILEEKGVLDVRQLYIAKQEGEQYYELEVAVELSDRCPGAKTSDLVFRGTKASVTVIARDMVQTAINNGSPYESLLTAWLAELFEFSATDSTTFLLSR